MKDAKAHHLAPGVSPQGRIGLFGGTFNPVHLGHLRAAEEIRESFCLDHLVFIPARIPPHKQREKIISPEHRLAMVRLAVRDNPFFSVSEFELNRRTTSYSVITIEHFRRERGEGAGLFFLMGTDAFLEISSWKDFARLFHLANFIVMSRPGYRQPELSSFLPVDVAAEFDYNPNEHCYLHVSGSKTFFREVTLLDFSSTEVRARVREGRSVRYLVCPEVEEYILTKGLYQG